MPKTYEEAVEQMAKLDQKLGAGQGAAKERAKLQRIIDAQEERLVAKSTTVKTRRGKRGKKS